MNSCTKTTADKVRKLARSWVNKNFWEIRMFIDLGLPEFDGMQKLWCVPLVACNESVDVLGEIWFDNKSDVVKCLLKDNLIEKIEDMVHIENDSAKPCFTCSHNKVILGDCVNVLDGFLDNSVQLIVTSPPYYNARPEYSKYTTYQEYLDFLRVVFIKCHSVLAEGRFCVVNISPVLEPRVSRNASSKRIAIPFDLHSIMDNIGFDFIDDIIWVKPVGAGWSSGRGRRFSVDRNPLQYKTVPVTEYILVYRKRTDKLIDWNIRHHRQDLVTNSKIYGNYDVTNVWNISPSANKLHPAVFPEELVRRIIRYYSFKDDVVLDPFAGSGTVGKVAYEMNRQFILIDKEEKYYQLMRNELSQIICDKVKIDYEENR